MTADGKFIVVFEGVKIVSKKAHNTRSEADLERQELVGRLIQEGKAEEAAKYQVKQVLNG